MGDYGRADRTGMQDGARSRYPSATPGDSGFPLAATAQDQFQRACDPGLKRFHADGLHRLQARSVRP